MINLLRNLRDFLIVLQSGFFDVEYYLSTNPDVNQSNKNPLWHFIRIGWTEGRNPSDYFDTNYYLSRYPDVNSAKINPLSHFLLFGISEERFPSMLTQKIGEHKIIKTFVNHPKILFFLRLLFNKKVQVDLKQYTDSLIKKRNARKPRFSIPDLSIKLKLVSQLKNWDGKPVTLVSFENKLWVIKKPICVEDLNRELLIYSLGKGLVNLAETKRLDHEELYELNQLGILSSELSIPSNVILIRLAQDYSTEELPLKDLDSAMAGEFVFSLWVRRRDASPWNRAYNDDGIPIFFDYHASLNNEPWLGDCDSFFVRMERGHPGTWRVIEQNETAIDTVSARKVRKGINYISNRQSFIKEVRAMTEKISTYEPNYSELIAASGFNPKVKEELIILLKLSKVELPRLVSKMTEVLFSPINQEDK